MPPCTPGTTEALRELPPGIQATSFGTTRDGTRVELFALTNGLGMTAWISTFGAIVTNLSVPDKASKPGSVILGFDQLEGYLGAHPYLGAMVGRVANRIAGGRFWLNGVEVQLTTNRGRNHLHGGVRGFDKVVWQAAPALEAYGPALRLTYESRDGEEGYPGTLRTSVTYTVSACNELRIECEATTDKATPVNLTNHMYFNLAGPGCGDVLSHELKIFAERYTPVDDALIPTGELSSVAGTPFDFTEAHSIGSRLAQVRGGYDHNYVLGSGGAKDPVLAARVREPSSGRTLDVLTTQPGLQFYTGNFLDGSLVGRGGAYRKHSGFCLETQHFPDSVNQPRFPSTILEPGDAYREVTIYRFGVE